MADHAGQVLVGLTLRPGRPGTNDLLVYLLPLEGEKAAGALSGHVILNKSSQPLSKCGDTCRTASVIVRGHQELSVRVDGPKGGVATLKLPDLPAPDGSALLQQAQAGSTSCGPIACSRRCPRGSPPSPVGTPSRPLTGWSPS